MARTAATAAAAAASPSVAPSVVRSRIHWKTTIEDAIHWIARNNSSEECSAEKGVKMLENWKIPNIPIDTNYASFPLI